MVMSRQSLVAALRVKKRNEHKASLRDRYNNHPIEWVEERAQGFMWSIPRKIAQSIVDNRRTAVQACHSAGKSWLMARIAAWWIDSHPPGSAFVITTAPTAKQVKTVLWKEIRRAWVVANLDGRLNQTEWWLNGEMVAMGRKPSDYDPTAFQGIHAKHCLVLIDEACGVPKPIVIAANSLAANEFSRVALIGNPDDPDSYFYEVCQPNSGYNVIVVSAFDTPNFTGEEVPQDVKDVLVSPVYVQDMIKDVGEDSPVYTSKVLGQFPENKADGIIPLSWIRQCQDDEEVDNAEYEDTLPIEIGMDVGAGGDETSLRVRRGKFAGEFVEAKTPHPSEAFYIAVDFIMATEASVIKIDVIGIGWGLIELLEQAKLRSIQGDSDGRGYYDERSGRRINISQIEVVPVNVGVKSTDPDKFPRLRDQMWWEIGRLLSQDKGWNLSQLDEQTVDQLIRPTWHVDIANRHRVETKQEMMKRTGRPSPNRADALLLAFCNPPVEDTEEILVIHDPVVIGPEI